MDRLYRFRSRSLLRPTLLTGHRFDIARQLADDELVAIDLAAGVVDIDTD